MQMGAEATCALGYIHGSRFTRPRVNVLEKITMDRFQMRKIERGLHWSFRQFKMAENGHLALVFFQKGSIPYLGQIFQNTRLRIHIGIAGIIPVSHTVLLPADGIARRSEFRLQRHSDPPELEGRA